MDTLVSPAWLEARLGSNDIIVIDATMHLPGSGRDARAEYEAAHIRGARFLDLASFEDADSNVPKAMPTPEQFADRMSELGVGPGSRIVLYDDSDIHSSARAWFILTHFGEDDVAILDGGLDRWRDEERHLSSRIIEHSPRSREEPDEFRQVATKEDVLLNLDIRARQVVDARDEARFAGADGSGSEGHIPGASNVPFVKVLNEDRTYKSPEDIRATFEAAGVDLDQPIITSCNSGMTASVLLFALDRAGLRDVALYDGSWLEWGADASTPKEKGGAS